MFKDEETEAAKRYEEIKNRWAMLIVKVQTGSDEKPLSAEEAMAVLAQYPEAMAFFEQKMAGVCDKISLALSAAEDNLQQKEQQIHSLSGDDRPAIKNLKQHILAVDMMKDEPVGAGREPKGGLSFSPDKRLDYKPIRNELGSFDWSVFIL